MATIKKAAPAVGQPGHAREKAAEGWKINQLDILEDPGGKIKAACDLIEYASYTNNTHPYQTEDMAVTRYIEGKYRRKDATGRLSSGLPPTVTAGYLMQVFMPHAVMDEKALRRFLKSKFPSRRTREVFHRIRNIERMDGPEKMGTALAHAKDGAVTQYFMAKAMKEGAGLLKKVSPFTPYHNVTLPLGDGTVGIMPLGVYVESYVEKNMSFIQPLADAIRKPNPAIRKDFDDVVAGLNKFLEYYPRRGTLVIDVPPAKGAPDVSFAALPLPGWGGMRN
jgi:hypothetical protein